MQYVFPLLTMNTNNKKITPEGTTPPCLVCFEEHSAVAAETPPREDCSD